MADQMDAEFTITYKLGDKSYTIRASAEIHSSIQADTNFAREYLQRSSTNSGTGTIPVEEESSQKGKSAELDSSQSPENFVWTRNCILLLLDEYGKRSELFRDPKQKKKLLWCGVAQAMVGHGYTLTWEAAERKFRNMKRTFVSALDNSKRSGRERVSWEYFDTFMEFFQNDKSVNLGPTLASNLPMPSDIVQPDATVPSPSTSWHLPEATPTTMNTPKRRRTNADAHRRRQQEVEKEKLLELRRLVDVVKTNNEIQQERNRLLERLVDVLEKK